jgi:hypothetical protein
MLPRSFETELGVKNTFSSLFVPPDLAAEWSLS